MNKESWKDWEREFPFLKEFGARNHMLGKALRDYVKKISVARIDRNLLMRRMSSIFKEATTLYLVVNNEISDEFRLCVRGQTHHTLVDGSPSLGLSICESFRGVEYSYIAEKIGNPHSISGIVDLVIYKPSKKPLFFNRETMTICESNATNLIRIA